MCADVCRRALRQRVEDQTAALFPDGRYRLGGQCHGSLPEKTAGINRRRAQDDSVINCPAYGPTGGVAVIGERRKPDACRAQSDQQNGILCVKY